MRASFRLSPIILMLALAAAADAGVACEVELVNNPDALLAETNAVVASGDSVILDRCGRWLNLARLVVESCVPEANIVDLSGSGQ